MKKKTTPTVFIRSIHVPSDAKVKYDGSPAFMQKKKKKLTVNQRLRALQPQNKNTKTNLYSKLMVYKSLIKPIKSYGIELWGAVKTSKVE